MSEPTLSVKSSQVDVERQIKRFKAAVLTVNDLCQNNTHREQMRRTIMDQAELLLRRLLNPDGADGPLHT